MITWQVVKMHLHSHHIFRFRGAHRSPQYCAKQYRIYAERSRVRHVQHCTAPLTSDLIYGQGSNSFFLEQRANRRACRFCDRESSFCSVDSRK